MGQLGDGTTTHRPYAVSVAGVGGAISLSAGYNFTCAALGTGEVRCWGYGPYMAIPGAAQFQTTPLAVPNLAGAVEVACGSGHTCARLLDGTVHCWGDNHFGQLGDGTNVDASSPVPMQDDLGAVLGQARELSSSANRTCVRVLDGSVRCAGAMPGDGTNNASNRAVPVLTAAGGAILKGVTGLGASGGGQYLIHVLAPHGRAFGTTVGDGSVGNRLSPVAILF